MKKVFKFLSGLLVLVVTIYSFYRLYLLIKKYDLLSILMGYCQVKDQDDKIVDISGRDVKFFAQKNDHNLKTFYDQLEVKGYRHVGQFGRSDLYIYQGMEVVIKHTTLFNAYYLFEVYNESFFEDQMVA